MNPVGHRRGIARAWTIGCLALAVGAPGCDQPRPSVEIVAFGDSTTSGPSERDYVEFLGDLLERSPEDWANEGDGGETAVEGLERLRSLLDRGMYPNAEVFVYWEGGNDLIDAMRGIDPLLLLSPVADNFPFSSEVNTLLDNIQAAIEATLGLAREAGLDVFVLNYFFLPSGSFNCDPLPLDLLLAFQAANANGYVTLLNERIESAANNQGATLIDVAALDEQLRGDPRNYENCNHLSATGNGIVAAVVADTLVANGY